MPDDLQCRVMQLRYPFAQPAFPAFCPDVFDMLGPQMAQSPHPLPLPLGNPKVHVPFRATKRCPKTDRTVKEVRNKKKGRIRDPVSLRHSFYIVEFHNAWRTPLVGTASCKVRLMTSLWMVSTMQCYG